jgi:diaminopimelate decarboxylase
MRTLSKEILNDISSIYGDSFYILDSDVFENNYQALTSAFTKYYPNFNIAYSYKTNYVPKLVKIVDRLGGYAEVVSDMEMQTALKAGVPYERIIWNGPVKNKENLKSFLLQGGTANVDSPAEFEYIKEIATNNLDKELNIGIRCNYEVGDGVLSRFGVDIDSEDFDYILSEIKVIHNINLIGLQAHFAKRSPEYWTKRTEGMFRAYKHVREKYGFKVKRLDIGGGIYGDMPETLRTQLKVEKTCFEDYAVRSAKLFAEYFNDIEDAPTLLVEPGTAIAADSMRYVCRVETIKTVRGKTIASANGSQKNISLSGLNPPMEVIVGGDKQETYEDVDIAGYTCIESDYIYKGYSGKLGIGDYLVYSNCGSYSLVMKPPFIFTNVPVLDISKDEVEVIKRAETFEDLFTTYTF